MLKFKHKIRQEIEILLTEIYEGAIIPFENISYVIIGEGRGKFSIITKQNRGLSVWSTMKLLEKITWNG